VCEYIVIPLQCIKKTTYAHVVISILQLKKIKLYFLCRRYVFKSLILKCLFFAFELSNSSKATACLEKSLSSPSYPQSYPQVLWIV
jgi:hypothetical protein